MKMKKIVFAAEVFGLIATLPIVMILQLSHAAGVLNETNFPSSAVKKNDKAIIHLSEKLKDKMANESFSITQETIFLTRTF
jgi:hypothetical protein